MRTIFITFLLFLFIPFSSYALDLDAANLYPNIIKSLKSQEKGWFLTGSDLIFTNPPDVNDLQTTSYPEINPKSIVVISYNLFYNDGYAMIDKPIDQNIPDKYEKEIIHQIKILTMERLYKEGVRRRTGVKKAPVEAKPIEKKQKIDESGMIKIEATGKKL